jgi:plastocyanin
MKGPNTHAFRALPFGRPSLRSDRRGLCLGPRRLDLRPAPSLTPPPASAAASGQPSASANPNLVTISALNIAYEQTSATAPAGKPFQIQFENKDAGTPHNVAIHQGSATGTEVFKGTVFPGVATQTYDVPALTAGTYAFECTVHPSMVGTLTVQ